MMLDFRIFILYLHKNNRFTDNLQVLFSALTLTNPINPSEQIQLTQAIKPN